MVKIHLANHYGFASLRQPSIFGKLIYFIFQLYLTETGRFNTYIFTMFYQNIYLFYHIFWIKGIKIKQFVIFVKKNSFRYIFATIFVKKYSFFKIALKKFKKLSNLNKNDTFIIFNKQNRKIIFNNLFRDEIYIDLTVLRPLRRNRTNFLYLNF